ncbi:MAG TPA: secondary thiamine-phosphate synthase enzyme YjbQ [Vicinamibacterales bacterium]
METLAAASLTQYATIRIATERPTQFVDLTEKLEALVAAAGVRTGILNVQSLHTTTAIIVNEHEPLLLADFAILLEKVAPSHTSYRHDDVTARTVNVTLGERPNGFAHCRALFLPSSVCLNVIDARLRLGRWQRVFLVELDGPQTREVSTVIVGEGCRS